MRVKFLAQGNWGLWWSSNSRLTDAKPPFRLYSDLFNNRWNINSLFGLKLNNSTWEEHKQCISWLKRRSERYFYSSICSNKLKTAKIPCFTYIVHARPGTVVQPYYTSILLLYVPGPVVTKLFRIRIKIRLRLNILSTMYFFKTYYTYLTIDWWYLRKYVLKTTLFYERKDTFYSCDRYENISPLTNRINFTIFNCLQHVL